MTAQQEADAARREALAAAERAEKSRQEMQALAAKPTPHGMVVTLSDVLFDTGSANLKPGAKRKLDQLAEFMKQHSERKLRIEGFTDSTGSVDTNQVLSERRAAAVRTALIERGVAPERVETVGYGPAFPVASNADAAGRQQNRRVEIVISDEQGNLARR
ncbi:MAG TPA: OmpA family protein [Burkholderiaceae bacterium]|nr:OmpA family protein [Burkholderiaceae bacterium]